MDKSTPSIWSATRLSPGSQRPEAPGPQDVRSAFQHDYDRVLFSTPVRRLSDKTQVWPMDENDGVRTRLTHSHEVANLARSIGTRVAKAVPGVFDDVDLAEVVQPILCAIGLSHDLGNPPFGHQGEVAIGRWFSRRASWIFTHVDEAKDSPLLPVPVSDSARPEFTDFDGNPQSFRLLTKLQTSLGRVGLDLTAATLSASLKYPVRALNRDRTKKSIKKYGYFESELPIVEWARKKTGLQEGQRHPLTWIMEACDDIAYSVLDGEDFLKKELASPDDIFVALRNNTRLQDTEPVKKLEAKFSELNRLDRAAPIIRDIKIAYLRAYLFEALIREASANYTAHSKSIRAFTHELPLMEGSVLCDSLKELARRYAFTHRSVLKMEAVGAAAIDALMTDFWMAIHLRKVGDDILSERTNAKARYIYSLISPNYLEEAQHTDDFRPTSLGMRYRELRLLTDMVSGMTDTFALNLWRTLKDVPDVSGS